MKKIIDGKTYNTDTADLLASASSGGRGDFRAWSEELYRTKKGAYFLAGRGGPMTSWSTVCSDGARSGGSGLRVLGVDDAKAWVEKHANSEYERIFGAAEEA